MKYLIIETVAVQPHLETSGEIALLKQDDKHDVSYLWLGDNLAWDDWALSRKYSLFGLSLDRRKRRFFEILTERHVNVLDDVHLSEVADKNCKHWAGQFTGTLAELKLLNYGEANLGMGVASSFISQKQDSLLDTAKYLPEIQRSLYTAAIIFEKARQAIISVQPDVVISFNGRFATTRPIFEAAKVEGIKSLRHERGATFKQFELFERPIHDFEYRENLINDYWTNSLSPNKKDIARNFYALKRQGDGIGWRSFVSNQKSGHIPLKNEGKRRIVYFSSSDDEFAAISDVTVQSEFGPQLEAAKRVIDLCAQIDDVELICRIHPNIAMKSAVQRARWHRLKGPNMTLIRAETKVDSYALLDSADVVITYGSAIGIEAAFWGKPSILLGPSAYRHSGAVYVPDNQKQLEDMLRNSDGLVPLEEGKSLPYGFYYLTFGIDHKFYQPETLFEGRFCEEDLHWAPRWLRILKFYIKKLLK